VVGSDADGRISTSFLVRADQIETFLAIGRHVNPDHFLSLNYQIQRVLYGAGVPVPVSVDTASDSSYFKLHLDSINLYNLGPDFLWQRDPLQLSEVPTTQSSLSSAVKIAARSQASRLRKRREPADSPWHPRSGGATC
jgi:hypothetical protein